MGVQNFNKFLAKKIQFSHFYIYIFLQRSLRMYIDNKEEVCTVDVLGWLSKLTQAQTHQHLPVSNQQQKHLKKVRNTFKANNKKNNDVNDLVLVSLLLTLNLFTTFSNAFIVDLKHVNVCWKTGTLLWLLPVLC